MLFARAKEGRTQLGAVKESFNSFDGPRQPIGGATPEGVELSRRRPSNQSLQSPNRSPGTCLLERLADQFFAFLPKRNSVLWIESVATRSFVKQAQPCIIRDDLTHVAVLAIPPS
jgi:hypothetical protein